jgi:leucyl aminopeptidase (aminopeptidase T)
MMMMMKRKLATAAVVILGTSLAVAQPTSTAIKPKLPAIPAVDHAALAEKLVATSANIKEGDIVEVHGGVADLALLEEIVIAVRKRGGHPLLTIDTEKIAKAMVGAAVPDKYDTQVPKLDLGLAKLINARIEIPAVRDPSIFAALAPERQAKRSAAHAPVNELALKRKLKSVVLDNGLAPSAARAKELGISEAELAKIFWDGVGADYTAVETSCKKLRDAIAAGSELRITHPNGTDLTVKVKGRKSFVSDGVTTDAEAKAGGPGIQVWLPAGEVYVTPVPKTAQGKIVDDRLLYMGKEVTGVTVDIAKGKSTSVSAKTGWDAVKGRYDAAGPGKTEIGVVDFGCNPAVKTGGKLETWMGAGMVSIALGGNLWAGGTNKEPFDLVLQLPGATVTLDGKPLIEAGQLK